MMRIILLIFLLGINGFGQTENWIEIGVDAEAIYYLDMDSVIWQKDAVSIMKKGLYNKTMTETLGGSPRVFKETRGLIQIDCVLRVNRVVEISMLDEYSTLVWSSGYMRNRPWEKVLKNTHAERTLDLVCSDASSV